MGFEAIYRYHKEIQKGEYDKSEVSEDSIKVGSPYDDVSLDVLAGKVMALLARRNILVVEIDIFELQKKKISFKETKEGIFIKNRKFKFDDGSDIEGEEEKSAQEKLDQLLAAHPELLNNFAKVADKPMQLTQSTQLTKLPVNVSPMSSLKGKKILRYELFDSKMFAGSEVHIRQNKMAFTNGRKYPIYEEKSASRENVLAGIVYLTVDDNGKEQIITDKVFRPEPKLIGDFGESDNGLSDRGLMWSGQESNNNVPDIRRR